MKVCPVCKSEFGRGEVFCPNDGARLSSLSEYVRASDAGDALVGTLLAGRYKVLRQIGEGGMGLVYEAEHVAIEKRVALKVLREDVSHRVEVVERFKQEAKSASRIGNDHIVDILDFGVTPAGASFFVMELLEGRDVADVLADEGTLDPKRAAKIILQCCQALSAAHAKGIVHRDMKPENIFLIERNGDPEFVKIVDFGIAKMSDIETQGAPGRKLTKTGMIFGTPEYMSPEQAKGVATLDHRVDVYALAVIFFELVAGRVPFVGDTFMGVLTQHMFDDPPDPMTLNPKLEISEGMLGFMMRGLSKDPDDRFRDCAQMVAELEDLIAGRNSGEVRGYRRTVMSVPASQPRTSSASVVESEPIPASSVPKSRIPMLLAGLLAFGGAMGLGTIFWPQPDDAEVAVDSPAGSEADLQAVPPLERPAQVPVEPPVTLAVEEVPPVEVAPMEVAEIQVQVSTEPSGATVEVSGRGVVCDETPCSFATPPNEELELRVRARNRVSTSFRFTPEQDMRISPADHAELRLARRRRSAPRTPPTKATGGNRPRQDGPLKIPDVFR